MSLPPTHELDALLLDLDDTILDGRAGMREAWDHVAALLVDHLPGADTTRVRGAIGEVTDWYWSDPEREQRGRLDLEAARREVLERVLERFGRADADLVHRTARHYTRHREASYRLAEGALAALERLRSRFGLLALVTNGASDPQRAKIERFELAGYFDHIQVEGEFGVGKPDTRVYDHVRSRLDVAPERCLMVGDNFRADVLGSLEAGLHAVWIDVEGRGRPPLPAPRPHATVRSLAELSGKI